MDQEDAPESLHPLPYDFTDPRIETVYANLSVAMIGNSEISLYFGTETLTGDGAQNTLSHRVIITHHQFLRMMEYWATRYDVIQTMFQNIPMSFNQVRQVDPERFDAAWAKINGPLKPQSEEDANQLEDAA